MILMRGSDARTSQMTPCVNVHAAKRKFKNFKTFSLVGFRDILFRSDSSKNDY